MKDKTTAFIWETNSQVRLCKEEAELKKEKQNTHHLQPRTMNPQMRLLFAKLSPGWVGRKGKKNVDNTAFMILESATSGHITLSTKYHTGSLSNFWAFFIILTEFKSWAFKSSSVSKCKHHSVLSTFFLFSLLTQVLQHSTNAALPLQFKRSFNKPTIKKNLLLEAILKY